MAKQNITLSIDQDVLKRVRGVAAQRGLSISAYLAQALDRAAERDEEYQRAMASALEHMKNAQPHGGRGIGDREALYDCQGLR
ncbi:MAG: hypothetical protein U0R19_36465 [Bryobacteraceae bacterium]